MMDYDHATCITAGELRALGVPVPENIPDCGWVPRGSWSMKVDPDTPSPAEACAARTDTLTIGFTVTFSEPFRWVTFDVVDGRGDYSLPEAAP